MSSPAGERTPYGRTLAAGRLRRCPLRGRLRLRRPRSARPPAPPPARRRLRSGRRPAVRLPGPASRRFVALGVRLAVGSGRRLRLLAPRPPGLSFPPPARTPLPWPGPAPLPPASASASPRPVPGVPPRRPAPLPARVARAPLPRPAPPGLRLRGPSLLRSRLRAVRAGGLLLRDPHSIRPCVRAVRAHGRRTGIPGGVGSLSCILRRLGRRLHVLLPLGLCRRVRPGGARPVPFAGRAGRLARPLAGTAPRRRLAVRLIGSAERRRLTVPLTGRGVATDGDVVRSRPAGRPFRLLLRATGDRSAPAAASVGTGGRRRSRSPPTSWPSTTTRVSSSP